MVVNEYHVDFRVPDKHSIQQNTCNGDDVFDGDSATCLLRIGKDFIFTTRCV